MKLTRKARKGCGVTVSNLAAPRQGEVVVIMINDYPHLIVTDRSHVPAALRAAADYAKSVGMDATMVCCIHSKSVSVYPPTSPEK